MASLPSYVAAAQPVPKDKRVPWFKTTAQTYAGIMLWFVFWMSVPSSGAPGSAGILAQGLGPAIIGVVIAALICHFLFYLVPGLMGMKTGLPLAVVGTSTYGVQGGFLMPGFLMGVLQFGWLAVNAYFSSELLAGFFGQQAMSPLHLTIGTVWAIVAALVGLKGINYVAKVATFLPLIPLVILLILAAKTISGVGSFKPDMLTAGATTAADMPSSLSLILFAVANIVGFFATAGAAGVDIASSNRDDKDVQLGGLAGVAGATIFTGCLALLIVAGTYGNGLMARQACRIEANRADGHDHGRRNREDLLAVAGDRGLPACLLQFADRGCELQEYSAEGEPIHLLRHRHGSLDRAGAFRQGWQCGRRVRHHWRVVRTDLRRHDGRFPSGWSQVGRAASRIQPGRLDFLGGGLRCGNLEWSVR